jgi:hypothetical protein
MERGLVETRLNTKAFVFSIENILRRSVPSTNRLMHQQNSVGVSDRSCHLERTCLLLQDERATLLPEISRDAI